MPLFYEYIYDNNARRLTISGAIVKKPPPFSSATARRHHPMERPGAKPGLEGSELEPVAEDRVGRRARTGRLRLDLIRADVERTPRIRHVDEVERPRIAVAIDAVERRRHVDARRCALKMVVAIGGIDERRHAVDDALIARQRDRVVRQHVAGREIAGGAEECDRRLVRLIDDRVRE